MRRGQYQREVVERLARIESNLDKICRELTGMVEQRSARPKEEISGQPDDRWLQEGMNNIMAFQAGQKRSDQK